MDQGRIERADPHALACLIYGSLAETAFWVAQKEDGDARLAQAAGSLGFAAARLVAQVLNG
ncbi:hypothetical protein [Alcaligenes sp. Lyrl_28]|jgi:hypothetical protein|uniref:hypothetical protein n=1 Tax=Alcaligenes sp. Lyrl_28 TaxID=3110924 RepID=UPI003F7BCDCC